MTVVLRNVGRAFQATLAHRRRGRALWGRGVPRHAARHRRGRRDAGRRSRAGGSHKAARAGQRRRSRDRVDRCGLLPPSRGGARRGRERGRHRHVPGQSAKVATASSSPRTSAPPDKLPSEDSWALERLTVRREAGGPSPSRPSRQPRAMARVSKPTAISTVSGEHDRSAVTAAAADRVEGVAEGMLERHSGRDGPVRLGGRSPPRRTTRPPRSPRRPRCGRPPRYPRRRSASPRHAREACRAARRSRWRRRGDRRRSRATAPTVPLREMGATPSPVRRAGSRLGQDLHPRRTGRRPRRRAGPAPTPDLRAP